MPKYLIQGSYVGAGMHGLHKDGGSKRREATQQAIEKMGGKLEAFYYAFGADDFVVILDMPTDVDMAALAIDAQATGEVDSRVTVLLTPEQVDQASHTIVKYRAPGK